MFKNPLKYQNGGATEERNVVINAISEIAQIPVEEVNVKLEQISQDQEAIQMLSDALNAVKQGDRNGYRIIQQMFNPQSSDTGMLKHGGKILDFICKHAKGGAIDKCGCGKKVSMQDGGLMRATSYYNNHANSGIIRKLQNFLYGRGYNVGIDGVFGKQTYDAIRQYQRDNGLKDDGMWGEDTNQVHRVLGAGDTTFNGSRSGAHPGTHTYTESFRDQTRYATPEQEDAYLRNVTNRAYNDSNWFWGDTDDARAARDFLYRRNGGNEFIQDIYENYTSPELQQQIAYSKLPTSVQQTRYNQGISDAISDAGKTGAKVGAAIGGSMLAAEAIPYLVETSPKLISGLKGVTSRSANNIWKPAQARTGTFFHRIPNGSMVNNATGRFISDTGMNLGEFAGGTDYAATIANNLRAIMPYGFKNGGEIKKKETSNVIKAQPGVTLPKEGEKVDYRFYPFIHIPYTDSLLVSSPKRDYEMVSWNTGDDNFKYLAMPINRTGYFNYHDDNYLGLPDTYGLDVKEPIKPGFWKSWSQGRNVYPIDSETYRKVDSLITANRTPEMQKHIDEIRAKSKNKSGGKIAKAQFGMPSMPLNPNIIQTIYNKVDTLLTPAHKWEKEHGTKVVGGIGLPAYVTPQSTVIDASKLLSHRIPNQNAYRKETEALMKSIKENTVPELKMPEHSVLDYDIDRSFSNINNNINVPDFSKVKLTDSWWDRNGEGLLWALPAVGIPATLLGQEIVNKYKNKNKNPGGGSR